MVVELISVGTEILLGNIVNTNAAYLAEQCALLGLSLFYQTAVGDNEERLAETMKTALGRSDVVILSGGLGPTKDDLTKEITAAVLGRELVKHEETEKNIAHFMKTRNIQVVTDNNWKQALIPSGAVVIDNPNGTAPGLIVEDKGKVVILLPGPPGELKPMFKNDIFPYLNKLQPEIICSKMVKICGMGESYVADQIEDLIDEQSNPTVAPYAKEGEVHLRVTAKAGSEEEALRMITPVVKDLKGRFKDNVYTTDEQETLEAALVRMLNERDLSLATAESCTGGMLSATIINVPGASEVMKEGLVTYSNEAKCKVLNVSGDTLGQYGAVSTQTAMEMALGGAAHAGADVCISVTGIAGPGGGSKEKPVGLVYIGCCIKGQTKVKEFRFLGDRSKIRKNAVVSALTFLRMCILGED